MTATIYTNRTARARCTFLRSVRCTGSIASCIAVGVIRFGIDAENGVCCDACAYIHITTGAYILAIAVDTFIGRCIWNRVIRAFIIACTTMVRVGAIDVLAGIHTIHDAEIRSGWVF